jgi:hypothetical protein
MSESPHSPAELVPDGTPPSRWRLLGPALATVAVVAVAAGAVLVVRERDGAAGDGANPPTLALSNPASLGSGTAKSPSGPLRPTGPLPAGPASAAVRTLPAGAAPQPTVVALAGALGLS